MHWAGMSAPLDHPPALASLCGQHGLSLFLDFDGTLVDLAPHPDAVRVPDQLGASLDQLAGRLGGAVALVSGRSLADLERLAGPLALPVAGSHGAELRLPGQPPPPAHPPAFLALLHTPVAAFASTRPGLLVETKSHGIALHYRAAPEIAGEVHAFAAALAHEHDLALKAGHCVAELVEPGIDKGQAVERLMQHPAFRTTTPVFIGDDWTDEDGFAAARRLGGWGIVVGDRPSPTARYRLPSPASLWQWLLAHD